MIILLPLRKTIIYQVYNCNCYAIICSYALKNNYPVLSHVTLPRTGALQIILSEMAHNDSIAYNPGK